MSTETETPVKKSILTRAMEAVRDEETNPTETKELTVEEIAAMRTLRKAKIFAGLAAGTFIATVAVIYRSAKDETSDEEIDPQD